MVMSCDYLKVREFLLMPEKRTLAHTRQGSRLPSGSARDNVQISRSTSTLRGYISIPTGT